MPFLRMQVSGGAASGIKSPAGEKAKPFRTAGGTAAEETPVLRANGVELNFSHGERQSR